MHGPVDVSVACCPASRAAKVTATATQQSAEIGPIPIKLAATAAGTSTAPSTCRSPARWDIDLVVTTSEFDAITTDVTLHLH